MQADPYFDATPDNVVAFLVTNDRLHEVLGLFLDAQPDSYNKLKAEQILIEYMMPECADALIRQYTAKVNIRKEYNEWWFLYHRNGEDYDETI